MEKGCEYEKPEVLADLQARPKEEKEPGTENPEPVNAY